ncbi:PAS domain S-box protein [Tolypothrix bouteillei]|uniref:PAS domain S-box protein n=1 Tax=Tolypothrix bouteillei TaxID=1246981 RepID=UPI0038B61A2F
MTDIVKATISEEIFAGGGEMGQVMRSLDWSQTLLGPVSQWAQSLKTAVSIILNSRYPMFVWWGAEYANLYNDAYRPMLGASKHPQFLGQSAKDCWAEVWDVLGPLADSVLTTGEPTWSDDLRLIMDRYGYLEETYFTFSYSPIRDESGGVGGVFCAVIETTARVIGERRLRTLRELASNAAHAKTVLEACDIAAETLYKNSADIPFALLYCLEEEGKRARLVKTAGVEAGTPATPECVLLTDAIDPWNLTKVNQTNTAEIIPDLTERFGKLPITFRVESPSKAIVMPIARSGKQQLAGLLVLGISPRLPFDDEYQGFFDLVVSNIATAIANADAYEAERKRAEALVELDRAKTVFFSNISHEFRTPLTLMLSPLEEILADPTGPHASDRSQLEIAHRNSLRLLKLVNTLLDFSRIEAGRMEAVYEPTDLAMVTADLAGVFRSAIESAGMQLFVNCPPLPERIYVDREMWEKIVLNLLSNAFKFTFEGEITVDLRYCSNRIELEVRDTGTGIPPAELPHIFERFHRVQGARGRTYEGSGIGLSLVRELVDLHGGTIQASSVIDEGTSFIVSIPTGCAHLPQEHIKSTSISATTAMVTIPHAEAVIPWLPEESGGVGEWESGQGGEFMPSPSPVRVLLVDDNADMRHYMKRLLNQKYEVQAVADGVAALAAVHQQTPDLVITDVMMPKLDGFGLLSKLRANPKTRTLPVILLSARAGEESRVEGLEAGADDYLIKPFSARELLARVEATLKMAQMRQEVARYEQILRVETEIAHSKINNILESITDAFVAFDHHWRYTYVNQQATELLHKSREELLGKQVWEEVFPETVGTLIYQEFHRAVTEQVAVVFEEFGQSIGKWLEIHAYPSPDGLAVYFRDITERKHSQAALQQSEERYRSLVEATASIVWVADGSGSIVSAPAWGTLTGQTQQQYMGWGWLDVVHPDDRQLTVQTWTEALQNKVSCEVEYRLLHYDGEYRYVYVRGVPILDVAGNVREWIGTVTDISDRKQAEIALRDSEQKYRNIVQTANEGIWLIDAETQTLYVNERMAQMLGYTTEEILERTVLEYCFPQDILSACKHIGSNFQGKNEQFDFRFRRKDGKELLVLACTSPVRDGQGNIIGALGMFTNVTARKQAEKALQQSEEHLKLANERFELAATAVNCLIYDWDIKRDLVERTDGLTRILGYSLAEAEPTSQWWCERVHPGDLQRVKEEAATVFTKSDRFTCEYRILNKSNQYTYVVDHGIVAARDAHGNPSRIVGSTVDITERKQAESERAQLLEREQQYTRRLQKLTEAFIAINSTSSLNERLRLITDKARDIIEAHQSVTSMTVDQNWAQAIHTISMSDKYARWQNYKVKPDGSGIYAFVCRTQRPVRMTQAELEAHPAWRGFGKEAANHPPMRGLLAAPFTNRNGKNIGLIQLSDKHSGEFTQEDEAMLVQLAQMASAAIDNAQLYEESQQANRVKDEFLAILSHELRSPLNPILGWVKLLQSRKLDNQKTVEALVTIERNAKLQTQLIDDLLDVSRILRGKLSLNIAPVSLKSIIEAALETVRLAAIAKSIQIQTVLEPHCRSNVRPHQLQVAGDPNRLQQVIWNLLSNAIKFTPNGGCVQIRLEQVGDAVQIQVTDNGKGISTEFLPYVFDYFRQADASTTRTHGGLGLGLAIVRHLVELHGGTVTAASPGVGQGASFTVMLPMLNFEPEIKEDEPTDSEPDLTGIRVLIVEDITDSREFLVLYLNNMERSQ